jgi:N-acetylglutamate synthase-like GNAT family acetyltransferase
MEVTIRRATRDDFPAIFLLIKEFASFQKSEEKLVTTVDQMLEDENLFQAFVALENKNIIGFCTFFYAYYSWSGKAIYLDDLYIKDSFRKNGIGKQLLNTVIALAKESNCRKVRWQVSKWNTNAIEFYKKMGADIDEIEINCDLFL